MAANIYQKVNEICRTFDFPAMIALLGENNEKDIVTAIISTGWYEAVLYLTQEMPYPFGFNELRAAIQAEYQAGVPQLNVLDCISAIADVALIYDDEEEWNSCFILAGSGPKLHRMVDVYTQWAEKNGIPIMLGNVLSRNQKEELEPMKNINSDINVEGGSSRAGVSKSFTSEVKTQDSKNLEAKSHDSLNHGEEDFVSTKNVGSSSSRTTPVKKAPKTKPISSEGTEVIDFVGHKSEDAPSQINDVLDDFFKN